MPGETAFPGMIDGLLMRPVLEAAEALRSGVVRAREETRHSVRDA